MTTTQAPLRLVIEQRGDDYLLTYSADGLRSILARVNDWDICPEHGDPSQVAHLIAAAPELLAALEDAVAYLEANRPKGNIRDIFTELNQYENAVMKPARAAIAKATGNA